MNNNVVEYIRANRYVYTREAIDERLRAEGYTEEEIAAAWRQMPPEEAAPGQPGPPVRAAGRGVLAVLVIVSGFLGLAGFVLLALTNLVLGSGGSSASGTRTAAQWFVNLGSLILLVGLIAGGSWLMRNRGWSFGNIAALVLAVAVVWYMIVLGTCLNTPISF